jgi:DNA-binding LytR/AlgR family response regulator
MNCIICADNVSSKLLAEFVGKSSSLILVGTFADSASAIMQLSKQHDIDLLLLDLEILEMNFIDFVSTLRYKPNIIVISSTDQFALQAFDISVVDYLLKPVNYSRFCRAIDKALRFYSRMEISNNIDNEIFIKNESSLVKLKLSEILYIEALENYVTLATSDKKFTIHFTMKAIEDQLPSELFIRVHRSFIVNKSLIHAIKENTVDLNIGNTYKSFPIGKSFKEQLLSNIITISK